MFWERFYTLCEQKKIKPNVFAKNVGLSSGLITKWKQGALPNTEALCKIAEYFGVSTDYLLTGTEKSPSPTLTDDEQEILSIFRKLTDKQKYKLIGRAEQLAEMNDTADEFLQEDIG